MLLDIKSTCCLLNLLTEQLGLFNIPNVDLMDDSDESEVDESALESELEALLSGKVVSKPKRSKPKAEPTVDIEKIAESLLHDDDGEEEDESNLSADEDLLNELQLIATETPPEEHATECLPNEPEKETSSEKSLTEACDGSVVAVLEERLNMYNEAIKAAKMIGDNSKVRRYDRAAKTLKKLLSSAKSGASVSAEDIPPVVSIPKSPQKRATAVSRDVSEPKPYVPELSAIDVTEPSPSQQSSTGLISPELIQNSNLSQSERLSLSQNLIVRKNQYKKAALQAKRDGDKNAALEYLKISKMCDALIESLEQGEIDSTEIPPPPPDPNSSSIVIKTDSQKKGHDETQTSAGGEISLNEPEDPAIFDAPPPPTTILEALQQRLEKYTKTKEAAELERNSGKVRRLQRIIKQYQVAIRDFKAGKEVNFDELPTPPGFAPIPIGNQSSVLTLAPKKPASPCTQEQNIDPAKSAIKKVEEKSTPSVPQRKPKVQRTNTVVDKQLDFLLERQKLFRQAALEAKKNGDIQQAKEYLRMSKGFDSMIEATKCGLPIDASTIPTPPQLESEFVIIDVAECIESDIGNAEETFQTLEKDLLHQIEACTKNKEHFLRLGDVSSASKFEKFGLESKKDLLVIQHLRKTGGLAPKFHYETRLFSMVKCHTDLGDNDLEVTVERGINLPGKPDDLDSYVRLEFPIPTEAPQKAKTHTVRDTNNPVFQEEFKFEFNRKSRSQLRQFKRQSLKLEVWAKGGFLRSDVLLGTASIKLVDLESVCLIHDCFNLMDGRKACGGKLEIKVRIREPLLTKQVEETCEKWLVIGS
ncbi:coiled-coil and C2 domain-containing protein 1-like isoform X2 [Stegodyphus dumicola]|uniref:coiled-coil and C2 domain-containing protein 1-like isoform X2 n=1 Tax=Stegodyphus dumicola TaxID=202533 RepID=UPI0015AC9F22|nr:coiled-coil and C2 domain-containing protein 1-like isoform X2 [Stegodyphus dumicola]